MCYFSQTDPTAAAEVIAKVKKYLVDSDFKFTDEKVDIISGSVEGVSGWITINFIEQTVLHKVKKCWV